MNKPLFIFEMANNHMGNLDHGIKIINELSKVSKLFMDDFDFAIKLQLRDSTIIHPDYLDRKDLFEIKRFIETMLPIESFINLKDEIKNFGFISICTPFDEISLKNLIDMDFDVFKIASCSFSDWPLIEGFSKVNKPIILSTSNAPIHTIDKVNDFFSHRKKDFAFMHCVSSYPTERHELELNQIDFLKSRYKNIAVGFSTHEIPEDVEPIKIAIAKGAMIFEKHVAIPYLNNPINKYSATPEQIKEWLISAKETFLMCGIKKNRMRFSQKSINGITPYMRGAFVNRDIKSGEVIRKKDLFFALPNIKKQVLAVDISKYSVITSLSQIKKNEPLLKDNIFIANTRNQVEDIIKDASFFLKKSNVAIQNGVKCNVSCHYGIEKFREYGALIIDLINLDYCKKIMVIFKNQKHPEHFHNKKEETFYILDGDIDLKIDDESKTLTKGDFVTIKKCQKHSFSSKNGAIIEEISTTHFEDDSFYTDEKIMNNQLRKINLNYYNDWE